MKQDRWCHTWVSLLIHWISSFVTFSTKENEKRSRRIRSIVTCLHQPFDFFSSCQMNQSSMHPITNIKTNIHLKKNESRLLTRNGTHVLWIIQGKWSCCFLRQRFIMWMKRILFFPLRVLIETEKRQDGFNWSFHRFLISSHSLFVYHWNQSVRYLFSKGHWMIFDHVDELL